MCSLIFTVPVQCMWPLGMCWLDNVPCLDGWHRCHEHDASCTVRNYSCCCRYGCRILLKGALKMLYFFNGYSSRKVCLGKN